VSRIPYSGRQLANIAAKNGEGFSAFLFVPVAVEECKALMIWRAVKQTPNMIGDVETHMALYKIPAMS